MTTLEIVLPILLVSGCIKMGEVLISAHGIIQNNATIEHVSSPEDILAIARKFRRLVYVPNTPRANDIMTEVISILGNIN